MAAPNSKFHAVAKGETLSIIAAANNTTASALAAINNLANTSMLAVGQGLYLTTEAAKEASATNATVKKTATKATITAFGLQSNAENVLFATWSWGNEETTAKYEIEWSYTTGDKDKSGKNLLWFIGSNTAIVVNKNNYSASRISVFNIPANAQKIAFRVKPVAEETTTNKWSTASSTSWTAEWTDKSQATFSYTPPVGVPSTPTVTINQYKLTAKLENISIDAESIEFEVYKNDATAPFDTSPLIAITAIKGASYACDVTPGGEYKVRCRAYKDGNYSEWSPLSAGSQTIPSTPTGINTCRANSTTSVYLEWEATDAAEKYDIEYTTKLQYFDGSNETTVLSDIEFTHYEITGLESGQQYFFRVRGTNDGGKSSWSGIASVIIGKAPAAPTTWSSTTTAITGEPLTLYWVHNAEDGSSQTLADLEIYANGTRIAPFDPIKNLTDEEVKDKISYYVLDTSSYVEGTKIEWRVRTAGITNTYGDWSVQRTIDIYAPPTLALTVTDKDGNTFASLASFPINIYALAGPNTQIPTGYQLTVTSDETYETVDQIGNAMTVNAGDQLYSRHFDTTEALRVELSASNIDLANGISYTITCLASMNSGLTATSTFKFKVSWSEVSFVPNAKVTLDSETLTTVIRPYCDDIQLVPHVVTYVNDSYTVTDETIDFVYGNVVSGAKTTTGETVYFGTTGEGVDVYYCRVEESSAVDNVTLSVYRREFDGSFTELATGLSNTDNTNITDPHPALDYARYRIVATNVNTGAVGFYDMPGLYIGGDSVVIQWAEDWTSFNTISDEPTEQPPWAGSLLKIPYNIDVSDKFAPDVSLVEYIGRKHPVSYYGTQLGVTSSWKFVIPSDDVETLYALRRLAIWQGDVYVREPSGSGYWAHVIPSWDQTHCETTIPVTLEVTRVEGGA